MLACAGVSAWVYIINVENPLTHPPTQHQVYRAPPANNDMDIIKYIILYWY